MAPRARGGRRSEPTVSAVAELDAGSADVRVEALPGVASAGVDEAVEARIRARLSDASRRRLASKSPERSRESGKRGPTRAIRGLLPESGAIPGRGTVGPIRGVPPSPV